VEFDEIKMQAGLNSFTLTPKQWIERIRAIGLTSKAGRYGGTYPSKVMTSGNMIRPPYFLALLSIHARHTYQ
jgi:hypothetical protein